MIWGQVNFENVSKAGKPPMKQSKSSVLTCEIMYAMFEQVMIDNAQSGGGCGAEQI
jgi:hypothetical protein